MHQFEQIDLSIVLCGAAGQGIQTVERLLAKTLKRSGYHVFGTKEYMSRVRGGINSTSIRMSSVPVRAYVDRIDILFPLSSDAVPHVFPRISATTLIVGNKNLYESEISSLPCKFIDIPFETLAKEIGNPIFANIIALGAFTGILQAPILVLKETVREYFRGKSEKIIINNLKAIDLGFKLGSQLLEEGRINLPIDKTPADSIKDKLLIDGREAVGLGVIAGGCNLEVFYPMAPSTGIGTFLAQYGQPFSLVVDQTEDELSAINKALGASYAGARAMISTAGGGFSLMTEGLSLQGQMELPLVLVIGQRPGPSTGMPTRMEQCDFELVLYAGSGDFPRVIFAPGTLEDTFSMTQQAFNLAARYNIPVFILTDQYLIDSYYDVESLDNSKYPIEKNIVKTERNYERYKDDESIFTPRGIPGYGDGLVDADSHSHNELGDITENPMIRIKNVDNRLEKLAFLKRQSIKPVYNGPENPKFLLVGWGSTYHIIAEALAILNNREIGFMHINQVYPLSNEVGNRLSNAKSTIMIENNVTGQLAKLIKLDFGHEFTHGILKYNGRCFSVEEIVQKVQVILEGK